jgi:uncharacterized Tic20 family protein
MTFELQSGGLQNEQELQTKKTAGFLSEPDHQQKPSQDKDERMWATFCHLGTFGGYFIPFGSIIVPLVIWLIQKDNYPLVDDQGKEALNFQISLYIYKLISFILALFVIGILFLIGLMIFDVVMTIVAAIKANEGIRFRYPMTIRFIK